MRDKEWEIQTTIRLFHKKTFPCIFSWTVNYGNMGHNTLGGGYPLSYQLDWASADRLIAELGRTYRIYAPKRFAKQGRFSDTDVIRYDEVSSAEEIVFHERSTYSAKEVVTPINQSLFYFTPEAFHESKGLGSKPILVFLRPCDIHAFEHQDKIYLHNGEPDSYYQRVRDNVHFVLMECCEGFDTCFCVSMGCNRTDHYAMAVRATEEGLLFEVQESALDPFFAQSVKADFTPEFIEANVNTVVIPEITDKEVLNALKVHPFWDSYNSRCISCGSCTLACSTCTCFTTRDRSYTDNADVGERRRITSSCQVEGFDEMAGGHSFRVTAGARLRYKMLHKFHGYKARFQDSHMCVGCGRCTSHCPAYISMTATIAKMSEAVAEIVAARGEDV